MKTMSLKFKLFIMGNFKHKQKYPLHKVVKNIVLSFYICSINSNVFFYISDAGYLCFSSFLLVIPDLPVIKLLYLSSKSTLFK